MRARVIFFLLLIAGEPLGPWFGTWKLNPAKSTSNSESRFKRVTLKVEPSQDGLKVTYDMVGIRGGVTHMEWIGKFDGKDYPVQGVDYVLTNAYTPVDERSYQIVIRVDGAVAATARVVVSPDGKMLTTSTVEKNDKGESITTTVVYDRQ
jgi:hypothetical protein